MSVFEPLSQYDYFDQADLLSILKKNLKVNHPVKNTLINLKLIIIILIKPI